MRPQVWELARLPDDSNVRAPPIGAEDIEAMGTCIDPTDHLLPGPDLGAVAHMGDVLVGALRVWLHDAGQSCVCHREPRRSGLRCLKWTRRVEV